MDEEEKKRATAMLKFDQDDDDEDETPDSNEGCIILVSFTNELMMCLVDI
jgi:hypothetical protein